MYDSQTSKDSEVKIFTDFIRNIEIAKIHYPYECMPLKK